MKSCKDNFDKYKNQYLEGMSAKETYRVAKKDGLNFSQCIRMLREVYGLSLIEAKEIIVTTDKQVDSLAEYQEKLAPLIESELDKLEA